MPKVTLENIAIKGIVSCVPKTRVENSSLYAEFGEKEVKKLCKMTGVQSWRVADDATCTSDLCYPAAKKLLASLNVNAESIDALIFISQTPDYIMPPTSYILQDKLGLGSNTATFDVNLGCSGYTYGLWLAGSLLQGPLKRVLLLVGDTCNKLTSDEDRSTQLLFGDAATATLVEKDPSAKPSYFILGSDGRGVKDLIISAGGFRDPRRGKQLPRIKGDDSNLRRADELYMNGGEVFNFSLDIVPPLIESLLEYSNTEKDAVDSFIFHQANEFMLKHIGKKAKIPKEKIPLIMSDFGNTSSASIPLAICQKLGDNLTKMPQKLALFGFGVGFSWGAALIDSAPIGIIDTLEV